MDAEIAALPAFTMTGPQPGTVSVAWPPVTSALTVSPPGVRASTGTRQASGFLSGSSRLNSPWARVTRVAPSTQADSCRVTRGTPGFSVKSCAMAVTGLPAAASISRQRSSETVFP